MEDPNNRETNIIENKDDYMRKKESLGDKHINSFVHILVRGCKGVFSLTRSRENLRDTDLNADYNHNHNLNIKTPFSPIPPFSSISLETCSRSRWDTFGRFVKK